MRGGPLRPTVQRHWRQSSSDEGCSCIGRRADASRCTLGRRPARPRPAPLSLSAALSLSLSLSLSFSLSLFLSLSLSLFLSPSLPVVNNGLNGLGTRPFRRLGGPGQDSSPAAPQASAAGRIARRTQGPAPGPACSKAIQTVGRVGGWSGQLAGPPPCRLAGLRCGPDGPAYTGSGARPGPQDPQRMPPLQGSAGPVGGPARRCRAARPAARNPRSSGKARGRVTAVTYGRDSEWSG